MYYFFFFQAEDGIRDYKVTGVQTCALPISEAGQSARVEQGKGVGVEDLNGLGSYRGVPIHGVEGELMGVAVGEVDVKAEGAAAIPGCGQSAGTTAGLQGPRIGGAGGPSVVELILHGQGSIAGDRLRVVGQRISVSSVDATPLALGGGI